MYRALRLPARTAAERPRDAAPVLSLLKAVDDTYVVSSERTFQARNRRAYAIEVLAAPSVMRTHPRSEPLRPVPPPEQEWRLNGRHVDQVVCDLDGSAARIVAPDPRWFALHKCWLAGKPTRDRFKAAKDRGQGQALLRVVRERMPHFPIDDSFVGELPAELLPYLEEAESRGD